MAKRQSMTEKVLEALREDIINGVYEENDMITEAQIPIGQMFTDAERNLPTAFAAVDAGLSGVMMAFDDKIMGGTHFERRNLLPKLKKLTDHGVSIAVCSQCLYEKSDLPLYEVGRKLLDCGVIPGRDMTTEAIVTKMMWALGQTEYPADHSFV